MNRSAILLCLTTLLVACSTAPEPIKSTDESAYPATPPIFTNLPSTRPKTKVLTQFAAQTIQQYSQDGEITIKNNVKFPIRAQSELGTMKVDDVADVEIGTLIVSAPTTQAPYGLMRRVSSIVQNSDGTTSIETQEATLSDVIAGSDIKPGDIPEKIVSAPVEVSMMAVPPSKAMATQSLPKVLSLDDAKRLSQQGWDFFPVGSSKCSNSSSPENPIKRETCVGLKLWMTAQVDVGWWWAFPYLKGFGVWANGYVSADNSFNFVTEVSPQPKEYKMPGYNQRLVETPGPATVFWAGPIPIVLTPKIILDLTAEGSLNLQAGASVRASSSIPNISFGLGSEYDPVKYGFYCGNTVKNNAWGCQEINNTSEKFEQTRQNLLNWNQMSNPLSVSAEVYANASLNYTVSTKLQIGVYLYGIVGLAEELSPYIGPRLNLRTSVNSTDFKVKTQLDGGIYAGVKGRLYGGIDVLGFKLQGDIFPQGDVIPEQTLINFGQYCWTESRRTT